MDEIQSTPSPDASSSKDELEEQSYRRSLEARMQQLMQDQLHTEESLTNLALLYDYRIRVGTVMPLHERALTIYEYHYGGRDHPEVATRLHRLASFYMSHGEHALAKPLYEQAYKIRLKQRGSVHPDTVSSFSELMWMDEQLGGTQKADELAHHFGQLQAQTQKTEDRVNMSEGQEEIKGADIKKEIKLELQTVDTSKHNPLELAELYEQQGKYAQTEEQLLQVLDGKLATKDSDPLGLAHFYIRLAGFYAKHSPHTQNAQMYYQWAEDIFKQHGLDNHAMKQMIDLTNAQPEKKRALKFPKSKAIFVIMLIIGIVAIVILFMLMIIM